MDGRTGMVAVAMVVLGAVACGDERETTAPPTDGRGAPETGAFVRTIRARFPASATLPVLPDSVVERFERDGATLRAVFPAASSRTSSRGARVELPVRARDPFTVTDEASGVSIEVTSNGATDASAEIGDGYVVYPGGHSSGSDVLHRVTAEGTEDYIVFERAPAESEISYAVRLKGVAGLRLVADTLELLDASGAPRLRLAPPWLADASGARHAARVELEGCAADKSPAAPWRRPVTAAGAARCEVHVRWDGAAVAYPALLDPAWTTTGDMVTPRAGHGASLLPSGQVLVSGGFIAFPLSSAELYDPAAATWAATAAMTWTRYRHTSSLRSGHVIAVGGNDAASAEAYDPVTGQWMGLPTPAGTRSWHSATLLPNGDLLVAGGVSSGPAAEVWDGVTWTTTGPVVFTHNAHIAALTGGKVIVAGGSGAFPAVKSAEVYDPATNQWTQRAPMNTARWRAAATTLPGGEVLVIGGNNELGTAVASTERFNPATNAWTLTGSLTAPNYGHTLLTLSDGKALAVYGSSSELYDPSSGIWVLAGALPSDHYNHTATVLLDDRVLIAGGGPVPTKATVFERLDDGGICAAPGECTSGLCVDNVCCNSACSGLCQACSAAKKGSGADGTCGPIASGSDPDGDCAQQSMSTCDTDGSCNGAGACRLWASGTVCVAQSCASATSQAESDLCNGSGTCVDKGTTACQPGYLCVGTACATSCSGDAQCTASYYCSGAACVPDQPDGGACTSASQCQSGFCVDGFCCESACGGACQACSQQKTGDPDGTCSGVAADTDPDSECGACSLCDGFGACAAVPADTDPKNACAPGAGFPASCGPDGMCDGAGACRVFAPPTVACGASSCQSGSVEGQLCNGAGQCLDSPPVSCAPYLCSGDHCGNVCSADAGCATGAYCTPQGGCAPKKAAGTGCAMANECLTTFCADQVCCNGACKAQCEACDAAPNVGSCSPIVGEPHPGHAACAGEDGVCAGSCNGVAVDACSYPGSSKACGSSCEDSVETKSACDGNGACVSGSPAQCDYVCDGDLCKTSCAGDGDCAVGYACNADGKCSPASGATCIDAHTVRAPEGLTTDCAPYRCEGNACLKVCKSIDDCVLPNVCAGGKCQPPASSGGGDDGGCGCALPGRHAPARAGLAALVLAALVAHRRRRARAEAFR